eukprot:CAMPEP_0172778374 /NCGR_PEP_ID=MMETSP1074-20121228/201872_1 /TAXON_ID=2916 /ORGANISM="Ceratium fusus, Strain PA161109" /LENGTH=497 /DNA_ID=CAMNT_0013615305 /DNA_START=76 /DNA_END=1566 /DNA_ORIENTATION=-
MFAGTRKITLMGLKITLMGLNITMCFAVPEMQHALSHFDDWKPPEFSQVVVAPSTLDKVFKKVLWNPSTGQNNVGAIEAAMQGTYQALPKNKHGLLSRNAAAYLVEKYVMQEYHYSIRGLGQDPAAAKASENDSSRKFGQTSAPDMLETLLESRHNGRGFALHDAALLLAMMRKLIMDLDETLVHEALFVLTSMNMLTENEAELSNMSIPTVVKVIWAWQWLHRHDRDKDEALFRIHMAAPTHVMSEFGELAMTLMEAKFYREQYSRNPFRARTFSIADTVQLAHEATEAMGVWQDHDCKAMKRYLRNLDPENDGRVPLHIVHNQPEIDDANGGKCSGSQNRKTTFAALEGWMADSDFFVECMEAPTHVMDEFGKLAMMLMEAKFYRERHSRNPFKAKTLSMADIVHLVREATEAMGTWQDHDCKAIKRYLIKLDPENDGRVPLEIVHSQPQINDTHGEQIFRFSESQDYLRSIGGLDESDPSHPQVLISNYVLGPA